MTYLKDTHLALSDVQASRPAQAISLSRVGVTQVEKIIRLRRPDGEQLYSTKIDCFVDLGPDQKGAHMSRFEEVINDAIGEIVLAETGLRADNLAAEIARTVRERQGALRAEVTLEARYPEHKPAPESAILTQEIYTLFGSAVASPSGTRRMIGVSAQGMTVCPCAQDLVEQRSATRLREAGFSEQEIELVFKNVPVASHNQRGTGTLHVGIPEGTGLNIEPTTLLGLVEGSMSSEIYELMKRSDEATVVEKAHKTPRFVEDCVREMIAGVIAAFPELPDEAFVCAHQENLETIHQHSVTAERFGLLGELRRELFKNQHVPRHVSRREWLDTHERD